MQIVDILKEAKWIGKRAEADADAKSMDAWMDKVVEHTTPGGQKRKVKVKSLSPEEQAKYRPKKEEKKDDKKEELKSKLKKKEEEIGVKPKKEKKKKKVKKEKAARMPRTLWNNIDVENNFSNAKHDLKFFGGPGGTIVTKGNNGQWYELDYISETREKGSHYKVKKAKTGKDGKPILESHHKLIGPTW